MHAGSFFRLLPRLPHAEFPRSALSQQQWGRAAAAGSIGRENLPRWRLLTRQEGKSAEAHGGRGRSGDWGDWGAEGAHSLRGAGVPKARRERATFELHGETWDDWYSWMQDVSSPAMRQHLQRERAYLRAIMARTHGPTLRLGCTRACGRACGGAAPSGAPGWGHGSAASAVHAGVAVRAGGGDGGQHASAHSCPS
ncbi:hypothetical protein CLOP_g4425 [Closterium sp. NIES-67]|nr:hypothetical protein CLOP_g4425 [Closterium sp. NIES-67]